MAEFKAGDTVAVYQMLDDRSGRRYKAVVEEVTRSSVRVRFPYRHSDEGGLVAWFWKQQCRRIVKVRAR